MRKVKAVTIKDIEILGLANELAGLEKRRVHDSIIRLLRKSLRAKIARLKRNG